MSSIELSPEDLSRMVRSDYLQAGLAVCFINGIYATVVSFTAYKLATERGWNCLLRPSHVVMLFMYAVSVLHLALRWDLVRYNFIDQGATSDSVLESLLAGRKWVTIVETVALHTITFLADCVMIWRCWILWDRKWLVIALPFLLLAAEFAIAITRIAINALQYDHDGFLLSQLAVRFTVAYLSLTLATTTLTTLLIIYRIVSVSAGGAKRYSSVIGIIAESAALYAAAVIVWLPFGLSTKFTDIIPSAMVVQIAGLASSLVVARVSLGMSQPDSTWQAPLSGLQWRVSDLGGNQHAVSSETATTYPDLVAHRESKVEGESV